MRISIALLLATIVLSATTGAVVTRITTPQPAIAAEGSASAAKVNWRAWMQLNKRQMDRIDQTLGKINANVWAQCAVAVNSPALYCEQ